MGEQDSEQVTQLLQAWRGGDGEALDRMLPQVDAELRKIARARLRAERPGHTLQTTALINEAFLRLVGQRHVPWQNRAHFFGIAAQMMRRILVDHARRRGAAKRGGPEAPITLDEGHAVVAGGAERQADVVAIHTALEKLEQLDPRQAKVVELRVFGGLKNDEIAEVLEVSRSTVKREWEAARAWLHRELSR